MTRGDAGAQQLALIDAGLRRFAAQLREGLDVAPAQRGQLEGVMALAVATGAIAAPALLQRARQLLPAHCDVQIDSGDHCRVELQLWQRRAPVIPSTAD